MASLFITHAGMNSVSEAIIYGVPIICLPLSGDQPFVAWQLADELKIGIRLQPNEALTVDCVVGTIQTVLADPQYRRNVQALSQDAKKYAGHKTAVALIIKLLHDRRKLSYDSLHVSRRDSFSNNAYHNLCFPVRGFHFKSKTRNLSLE